MNFFAMLKDDTIADIFGKVVDDLEKKLENIEKIVDDLQEMLDGLDIQKLETSNGYYIVYKDIYYAMPNHLFSVFNEPKVVILDYPYKSEILRYPTYFDILREGFKSSYNPEAEYRGYYSGFSGSLVDIEEKEEIDGVKYYNLFFYPG
jgi:hypothetical protein